MFRLDSDVEITLGLLNVVEENSSVTQRSAARDLGIALGLTNTYLKRCVKKGLIKVQQAPPNRYAYYLTPRGLAEKSRLTAEYLTQGFEFFRAARDHCSRIIADCEDSNFRRLVLHGLTDIAEIVFICAVNHSVEIVGILDDSSAVATYADVPVVGRFEDLPEFDAVIVTDVGDAQRSYTRLVQRVSRERVLVPDILNVTPRNSAEDHTP